MSSEAVHGSESERDVQSLTHGRVVACFDDDSILVDLPSGPTRRVRCDRLIVAEGQDLRLARGDRVMVWLDGNASDAGVVVGRLGPSAAPAAEAAQDAPDELVIEALRNLTLRCGEGSITIRADGKLLIKGKDLVSRATRTNRIKGGSVAIN